MEDRTVDTTLISCHTPTLHKPVPMQTRVKIPIYYLGEQQTGTVAGIAFQHVVFAYIVILDEPFFYQAEFITAITVLGSELMDENGEFAWKLP